MNPVYANLIDALGEDIPVDAVNRVIGMIPADTNSDEFLTHGRGWVALASIIDVCLVGSVVMRLEKCDGMIDIDSKARQLEELLERVQSSEVSSGVTDDDAAEALMEILFPTVEEPESESETTVDESAATKVANWFDNQSDTTKVGIGFLSGVVIVLALTALFSSKE